MTDGPEVGVDFGADFRSQLSTPISDCMSSALGYVNMSAYNFVRSGPNFTCCMFTVFRWQYFDSKLKMLRGQEVYVITDVCCVVISKILFLLVYKTKTKLIFLSYCLLLDVVL